MTTRIQIAALRGQLRLIGAGMTIKGLTKTKALEVAGNVTGEKYKRGEHKKAADDIDKWLKEDFARENADSLAQIAMLKYDLEVNPEKLIFDELVRDPDQDLEEMIKDVAMKVLTS